MILSLTIGPTWYWMPDVFERFFADFGRKPSDYYKLNKLNPGYQVYFGVEDSLIISGELEKSISSLKRGARKLIASKEISKICQR